MGQATANLPNSIDPPVPIGNADELLSQLAGEEIDRLLAEADVQAETAPETPIAEATPPQPISTEPQDAPPAADAAVDEALLSTSDDDLDAQLAASAAAHAPKADPFEAQVNELFNELKDLPEEKPPSPAAADIPPHAVSQPHSAQAAIAAELDASSAAERAALQGSASTSAAPAQPAVVVRPSMVVRILEIVNAPVSSLPDSVRDMVGKIAILTMMNSIGVLLYLFLFRK